MAIKRPEKKAAAFSSCGSLLNLTMFTEGSTHWRPIPSMTPGQITRGKGIGARGYSAPLEFVNFVRSAGSAASRLLHCFIDGSAVIHVHHGRLLCLSIPRPLSPEPLHWWYMFPECPRQIHPQQEGNWYCWNQSTRTHMHRCFVPPARVPVVPLNSHAASGCPPVRTRSSLPDRISSGLECRSARCSEMQRWKSSRS